jgi:hypothetical protein
MASLNKPHRAALTIEEHKQPTARWYVVSGPNQDAECTFEVDAHLIDFENWAYPDALFVVLIPCSHGWPTFLYTPGEGLEGRPYEVVITMALAAYRAAHPGLIPLAALQEVAEAEPDRR